MTAERPADVTALTDVATAAYIADLRAALRGVKGEASCTCADRDGLTDSRGCGRHYLLALLDDLAATRAERAAARAEGYEAGRAEVTAAVEAIAGDEHGWLCSTNPNLDGPGGPCDCLIGGVRAALASPSSVLADITDEARAEGYEAGYAEGYADGRDPP